MNIYLHLAEDKGKRHLTIHKIEKYENCNWINLSRNTIYVSSIKEKEK